MGVTSTRLGSVRGQRVRVLGRSDERHILVERSASISPSLLDDGGLHLLADFVRKMGMGGVLGGRSEHLVSGLTA